MKKALLAVIVLFALAGSVFAKDVWVKGHYRDSDGDGYKETYVEPHYRTAPDSNRLNNYSTKGNTNPYTGIPGTVNPSDNPYQATPFNKNSYGK